MQKFEKNLRKIQLCDKTPLTDVDLDIPHKELDFLKALELSQFQRYYDNQIRIILTDKGMTYFHDKREKRLSFWKEHFINFLSGFISGVAVTLASTWLITILITK